MDGKEREGNGRNGKGGGRKRASVAAVEALFSEFEALYGSRFADMWRHTDVAYVKSMWAGALGSLTADEIRTGLSGCRDRPWPPSLPEFMMLCRPESDAEKAFVLAQEQVSRRLCGEDVWPERALYWAAVAFGFYDLRSMSWSLAKNRWSRIWAEKRQRETELPPVPAAREALVAPGRNLTDAETARRHLARLKRMVGERRAPVGRPGKNGKPPGPGKGGFPDGREG